MTTIAATSLSELEAQASSVDKVMTLARRELTRDKEYVFSCLYTSLAKREVRRFEVALGRCLERLTESQLLEVAAILAHAAETAEPHIDHGHRQMPHMRWFEKKTFHSFCRLVERVTQIRVSLLSEAERRGHAAAIVNGPVVSPYIHQQAVRAKAFLRPVPREADAFVDPDYGF